MPIVGGGLLVPVRINSSASPCPARRRGGGGGSGAADPAAPPAGGPVAHERGAALRKKAVYKQLDGIDEITSESEEALRRMSEEENRASRRMCRTTSGYGQRVRAERCFSSLKRALGYRASLKSRATWSAKSAPRSRSTTT